MAPSRLVGAGLLFPLPLSRVLVGDVEHLRGVFSRSARAGSCLIVYTLQHCRNLSSHRPTSVTHQHLACTHTYPGSFIWRGWPRVLAHATAGEAWRREHPEAPPPRLPGLLALSTCPLSVRRATSEPSLPIYFLYWHRETWRQHDDVLKIRAGGPYRYRPGLQRDGTNHHPRPEYQYVGGRHRHINRQTNRQTRRVEGGKWPGGRIS